MGLQAEVGMEEMWILLMRLDKCAESGHGSVPTEKPHTMDANAILKSTEEHMKKAVEYLIHEFAGLRTGKATPMLVENIDIKVSIYGGTHMKLKQMATISTPEARLLMVQPFDTATLQDIERGIREANIGINPSTEGKSIRLPVPELTEERRRDMVKVLKGQAEEARVRIRSARRDGMEAAKKGEKEKLLTEDERRGVEEKIQKLTDVHVKEIDEHAKRKEAEVMTV